MTVPGLVREGEKHLTYLGDAVYAVFDGFHFWLRTTDGITVTNEVALDPSVLRHFREYVDHIIKEETQRT